MLILINISIFVMRKQFKIRKLCIAESIFEHF